MGPYDPGVPVDIIRKRELRRLQRERWAHIALWVLQGLLLLALVLGITVIEIEP